MFDFDLRFERVRAEIDRTKMGMNGQRREWDVIVKV